MENPNPKPLTGSKWSLERRLQFIDFRLRWEGRLNRRDLIEFFAVSVPQASMDISKYNDLAPGNLAYDLSSRSYLATDAFKPLFSRSSSVRYLTELWATKRGLMESSTSFLDVGVPIGVVPTPERIVDDKTVHTLVTAIRERLQVVVTYQSMTSAEPTVRYLSPHALGNDGFRWHARAYCHTKNEFRDFVIARMLTITKASPSEVNADEDQIWNNLITLVIVPNPGLTAAKKKVLELDYGMTNGKAELICRQAFLFYTLKRLGLDTRITDNPAAQQICLQNWEEVKQYIDDALTKGGN